ncbi:MAG: S10 family serine carboxypeptidase-like protein [Pyramidobacter sp.]
MENEVTLPKRFFDSPQRAEDQIVLQGQTLKYSITAEEIPICDDDGIEQARSFCVSYELTHGDTSRPVTFAFNGKPGTSTLYLHMACLAPKTYSLEGTGSDVPQRPFTVTDNAATLLDFSDLVFIDPVGTGFSTVTNHERARQYYGVRQDVDAMARVVRNWLVRHRRHASPLFIVGESYGGLRGSGLVLRLQHMHMMPTGFIAISPALSYGELHTSMLYEHHLVHTVPAMTAAAWFHKKLDADLLARAMEDVRAEAAQWAQSDYLAFLWKGSEASENERRSTLEGLRRYTALPPEVLKAHNFRINDKQFAGLLLADEGRVTSYFDSRLSHPGHSFDATADAQTYTMSAACYTAFYEYFGRMIKLPENPDYLLYNPKVDGGKWDFASGYLPTSTGESPRAGGFASLLADLCTAMKMDPKLKFFACAGHFDLHCSIDTTLYCIRHMDIPERLRRNITFKTYWGGHMFYSNPEAHLLFRQDLKLFYERALK